MLKTLMRKIVLAAVVAALPVYAAAQQSSPASKPSSKSKTLHPVSRNPCARSMAWALPRSRARVHVLRLEAALASKVVGVHGGNSTPRYR